MLALLLLFLCNLMNVTSVIMVGIIAYKIADIYVDDVIRGMNFCYGKHRSCKE